MNSFADVIQPNNKATTFVYGFVCVLLGSLFLALMSRIKLFLWFTPVPLTMQTFAVLLLGALLGSRRGAYAVLAFIFEGAIGLPVFPSGIGGFARVIGPTGGYLMGFVLCAFLVGYLLEKGWRHHYLKTFGALTLGSLIILLCGVIWLSLYVGVHKALYMGLFPFLVGDCLKLIAATLLIPSVWKLIGRT